MIFVGDIAVANELHSQQLLAIFRDHSNLFGEEALIVNLEGLLSEEELTESKTPVLYNHASVLKAFKQGNVRIAALANNHTLDLPERFAYTTQQLKESKILQVGAGNSEVNAVEPVLIKEGDEEVFVFNYCWDFLLYHQKNPSLDIFVAEMKEDAILLQVKKTKNDFPNASLVVYFHWSFDLETIPFPLYRKFSRELIDGGVDVVVGAHSHCVQGGEKYKNGYIIYGLGNFFIPNGVFANGRLVFPEWAREEWAIQWSPKTKKAQCHWFEYQRKAEDHNLRHLASEIFEDSLRLKRISPYAEMGHEEYIAYYKQHRRKKFLIPIFTDHRNKLGNRLKTKWLKGRAKLARSLAKLKVIQWQR
jgi:hypothetical protein